MCKCSSFRNSKFYRLIIRNYTKQISTTYLVKSKIPRTYIYFYPTKTDRIPNLKFLHFIHVFYKSCTTCQVPTLTE